MAQFDGTILPGGEGKITLRVKTGGAQGNISKSARVYTNDPHKVVEIIRIKASVKTPIHLSPRYVYLKGKAGDPVSRSVTIKAGEDKGLELEPVHFNLDKKVSYRIEEIQTGKVFRVYFTNVLGTPGTYYGVLKLKTNYPDKPEVSISIRGKFLGSSQTKKP